MPRLTDTDAIATWEREPSGYIGRNTGPRREPGAICYICGDDVPPGPRFGLEACCDRDECREAMVRR